MAGTDKITCEKMKEAIGVILAFYEQEVENKQLKDGELKNKIMELKTNPEIQEKLERMECKKRGPKRRHRKMLDKLDQDFNIGKYSRLVAMMLRCQYKGQDDGDDGEDDDEGDA